jgi:hypothetical protein
VTDVRISSEVDADMRQYRFERSSGLPIDYFKPDPLDVFVRWRWLAIVVLIVAIALAGFTASDLPNY